MRHSACIGRIGALAFALGVGIGLGATPAVALADETASSSASSEGGPSKPQRPASESSGAESDSSDTDTGASHDTNVDTDADAEDRAADDDDDADADADVTEVDPEDSTRATPISVQDEATEVDVAEEPEPADSAPALGVPTEAPSPAPEPTNPQAEATVDIPAPPSEEQTPAPMPAPTAVTLSSILSSLLTPTDTPNTPAESPLWLVAAAALRRQIDPATTYQATANSASLTAEQADAIRRLGEILLDGPPTAMVATDTRAYLAHAGSKSITVIDTLNGAVLQTISLRYTPTNLAVTPSGNRLYISNGIAGTVSVLNTATESVIKTIRVGRTPTALAVNANGSRVYVVNSDDGTVSKISTLTNTVVGKVYGVAEGVSEITISPDGSTIYTLSSTTGQVSRFSSTALRAQQTVAVTPASQGITFSADGSQVFVADIAGSIRVLDAATGQQVDSIAVTAGLPFDIAASPDGTTLYVARSEDGKLSAYDIATKTELTSVIANPYEVDGPPLISVSPDGTQLYWAEFGGTRVNVIALVPDNADPVAQAPVVNAPNTSGEVTGSVTVTDPEGRPLTYEVITTDKGSVTVTRGADGAFAFTYKATSAARHEAAADDAAPETKQDTFVLTFTDGQRGVVSVPITVTIPPANAAPTATVRSSVSWLSAKVLGTITARDADRDTLTYLASPTAKGGTVTIGDDGRFTYTPTAAARHAAANANATEADKQDTFDVVINDGHGGLTTLTVTVTVKPGNDAPDARVRTTASWFGPEVYGTVVARDQDRDGLTFTASDTAKGVVIVMDSRGRFTYTPAEAARHAAAAAEATAADKQDTFDITVDDGHGGVTTVAVTVRIKPVNAAPSGASAAELFTNPNSGLTTGKITAVDADGDSLTYRVSPSTGRGIVDVAADGTFTYRPTEAAREAASRPFAPSWVRTDRFRVTVDDGHGGTTTLTVRVPIAPTGYVNQAPTDGKYTAGQPNPSSGKVSGTVTAADPDRDDIYYLGSGQTAKGGTVVVERDGRFVYTPTDAARQQAASPDASDEDRQDSFVVTAIDQYAATLAVPVTVSILPWAASIAGLV
ncbi:Ig-like domain-containing protein [Mycolicibacterium gilvum]|uniref:VCBS repeat-containing protein,YVTN family beta-propeller repeat protein n=1 Tax=Mycolicibacterium gilvum (strain DSM 45189 / LMG 24558 / Spyr1) TaxID=278137 RepID=E6TG50_MYCSR|nr:Ig-like domain-containing protein [Mycolicibacterium gilvum]ADT98903.1 VCBS repeat-containing protein,YVTN family beta-propeller repeat protein [Mycolicibacterium gilvum Spyr1]